MRPPREDRIITPYQVWRSAAAVWRISIRDPQFAHVLVVRIACQEQWSEDSQWNSSVNTSLSTVPKVNVYIIRQFITSVVCLSVVCNVCIVAKRCVLEQKLLLTAYRSRIQGIDWYQNEWPWPLFRGRLRSCQPLRDICHWISRKPLEIGAWFQVTTNKMFYGESIGHVAMTSRNAERSNSWPNTLTAQYLEDAI